MHLPETLRQLLAGGLAAAGFLALFFGLALKWWLALMLGVAIYGAVLLVVRRRLLAEEILVGNRVTAADLRNAETHLDRIEARLRKAAEAAPRRDKIEITEMAGHVLSLRQQISEDPRDYRSAKRFIDHHLPHMTSTIESYVSLSARARGAQAERLQELSTRIRDYTPVVRAIDQACLENDFNALEAEVEALGTQIERIRGVQ